jgi:hypothetical protein
MIFAQDLESLFEVRMSDEGLFDSILLSLLEDGIGGFFEIISPHQMIIGFAQILECVR